MNDQSVFFHFQNQQQLPLIIEAKDKKIAHAAGLLAYLQKYTIEFKQSLLQYGAVLFRGFNVLSPELFLSSIKTCSLGSLFHYDLCAVPRTKLMAEGIYTSINFNECFAIPMHSEKAYDPEFPNHIYFNAIKVAETGGQTLLANAHHVWEDLPVSLQKKFDSKGIRYRKYYYGESFLHRMVQYVGKGMNSQTWMDAFNTQEKTAAELKIKQEQRVWRWVSKGNGLITEITLPAARKHPVTDQIVWFNHSAHRNYYYNAFQGLEMYLNPIAQKIMKCKRLLPYVAFFGDGEPISRKEADTIHQAIQNNIIQVQWESGDFLVVDNFLCMHGKKPHHGTRHLLVGMTKT